MVSGGTAATYMGKKNKRGGRSLAGQIRRDDRYWKKQGWTTDEIDEFRLEHYGSIPAGSHGADGEAPAD